MKRFSKILFLMLALVALLTAFSIVALAADEAERATPVTYSGTNNAAEMDFNFQKDVATGAVKSYTSTKRGVFYIDATLDGNKYLNAEYVYNDSEDTRTGNTYEIHSTYTRTDAPLSKYPVMAIDFDIMSELGRFPTDTKSNATYFTLYLYKGKSTSLALGSRIDFANLKLRDLKLDPYEWLHLTYVIEYLGSTPAEGSTNIPGKFIAHFYVNGVKLEYTQTFDLTENESWNTNFGNALSKTMVEMIKIQCERFSANAYEAHLGFDNFEFNYFPADENGNCLYTLDEIGNYVYDSGSYDLPETSAPAGAVRTDGNGKEHYYATGEEAFAEAEDGDTIVLLKDMQELVIIDKALTVKTALTSGKTTVKYKSFNFDYVTTNGYIATPDETNATTLIFTKNENSYTVNWNPVCEGECTCPGGLHPFNYSTTVALGANPIYPLSTEIGINNGFLFDFLGWSTEKDGEIVDLSTITTENAGDVINLYPVCNVTAYAIEYITAGGVSTYYFASDYATVMNAAASGSTVKLHADITVNATIKITKTFTLDLNGHTFTWYNLVETVTETVDGVTATTTKGAKADHVFLAQYSGEEAKDFKIISSNSGAEIYISQVERSTTIVDGVVTESTNTKTSIPYLFYYKAAVNLTVSLIGDITIYGGAIFYNDWDVNLNSNTVNLDGITVHGITTGVFMRFNEGADININNTRLYYVNGSVFSNYNSQKTSKTNITITNSVIFGEITLFRGGTNDTLYIEQSYIYTKSAQNGVTLGEGAKFDRYYYKLMNNADINSGYVLTPIWESKSFTYVSAKSYSIDPETLDPIFSFETITDTRTYSAAVMKCSEVKNSITDAMFSMFYYTNFNMALYIPVEEGKTIASVAGFTLNPETVKIDGNEYYVYVKETTTTGAADTVVATVNYTVGSDSYRQTFYVSALVYADLVLNYPLEEVETKAVANMVRYIKEARTVAGLEISDKFGALEALYTLEDYKNASEYDDLGVDYSSLSGISASFAISGSNAGYLIKINSATFKNAENAVVEIRFVGGDVIVGSGEFVTVTDESGAVIESYYKYLTTNTKVYDIVDKAIEINITIPAAEGAEALNLSGTYSVGAYINAMDNDLAKAMYEFGVASKAYREFLETL